MSVAGVNRGVVEVWRGVGEFAGGVVVGAGGFEVVGRGGGDVDDVDGGGAPAALQPLPSPLYRKSTFCSDPLFAQSVLYHQFRAPPSPTNVKLPVLNTTISYSLYRADMPGTILRRWLSTSSPAGTTSLLFPNFGASWYMMTFRGLKCSLSTLPAFDKNDSSVFLWSLFE